MDRAHTSFVMHILNTFIVFFIIKEKKRAIGGTIYFIALFI